MKYLYGFTGTCGVAQTHRFVVQVRVKHAVGMGFVGTGVGWTSPTHAIPMCHPTPVERSMWEPDRADPICGVHHNIPSVSSAYSRDRFWIVCSEPPYPMSRTYCHLEDVISGVRYDGPIHTHRFYSNGWSIFTLPSPHPHEHHVLCILTRYIHLSHLDILQCH